MRERSEVWIFGMTVATAAAVLVSITLAQLILALACGAWILFRPKPLRLPRYCLPLGAFMVTTLVSVLLSSEPAAGQPTLRKLVLFSIGLLAANFVTSVQRAKLSYALLILIAAISSLLGATQFFFAYRQFLITGALGDDPTVLARATGFMSHWMTYGGELLLVWCIAPPAVMLLGRRWLLPVPAIGIGIVSGFTRSVWLGAAAGAAATASALPRRIVLPILTLVGIVTVALSPLIYHRLSMSLEEGFGPDVGRMALLDAGLEMIQQHPLFGVGPGRIESEFPAYHGEEDLDTFYYGHMHNNFLQIGAERGLISLITFVWFLVELYRGLRQLRQSSDPSVALAALAASGALAGFVVAGLFEFNFGDSEVLMLFLFIVSLPFALEGGREAAAKTTEPT